MSSGDTTPLPRSILRREAPPLAVWTAAAALLLLPLVYQPEAFHVYGLPKATVFRGAVVLILLAGSLRLLGPREPHLRLRAPDLLQASFLTWLGLSALVSGWPGASFFGLSPRYEGVLGFVGYAAFYWTASRVSLGQGRLLLRAISLSGAALGAAALLEMIGPFRPPGYGLYGVRAVSPMGNPVFLGAWLATAIPATVALLTLTRSRLEGTLLFAALAFQAGGLYLSSGRGAWVGTVAGAGVGLAALAVLLSRLGRRGEGRTRRHRRMLAGLLLAAGVLAGALATTALVAPTGVPGSGTRAAEAVAALSGEGGGTAATRLIMWRATLGLVAEHPLLGSGPETFLGEFPRVRPLELLRLEDASAYPDRPHNHWLYLAQAAGLPALGLHLAFLAALVFGAAARLLPLRSRTGGARTTSPALSWQRAAVASALLAGAVAYEAQALFSFSLPWTTPAAMVLLGLLVRVSARRGSLGAVELRGWPVRVLGVALLLPALLLVSLSVRDPWADREIRRGLAGGQASAVSLARAVHLSPRDAGYTLEAGRAYERIALERSDAASLKAALDLYREAERRIPSHPDVLFSIARLEAMSGRVADAMQTYERVLDRDRYHPDSLFNLAALRLENGDPAGATPLLETLVSFRPADAEAWYYLGAALEAQGRPREARAAYDEALRYDPLLERAAEALERLTGG